MNPTQSHREQAESLSTMESAISTGEACEVNAAEVETVGLIDAAEQVAAAKFSCAVCNKSITPRQLTYTAAGGTKCHADSFDCGANYHSPICCCPQCNEQRRARELSRNRKRIRDNGGDSETSSDDYWKAVDAAMDEIRYREWSKTHE